MDDSTADVIWVHSQPVTIPTGTFEKHEEPRCLIRFSGPVRDTWKESLRAASIRIEFWAPPLGACLALPPGMGASELQRFPFIAGAVGYAQHHCHRPTPTHSEAHKRRTGLPDGLVDLVTFGRTRTEHVEEQLRSLGIPVVDRSSSKLRVKYDGDLAVLRDLVGVKIADPARAPVLLGTTLISNATSPASVTTAAATPVPAIPWTFDGTGEIIAVADTGLDAGMVGTGLHQDFQGRVTFLKSWSIAPSWSEVVVQPGADDGPADRNTGHGTHVAGLAAGDGSLGLGAHPGAAPGAKIVFQAIEQFCAINTQYQSRYASGYYLAGRPLDLRDLFLEARSQGARIHVNSWGDPANGGYTDDCHEADLFLHENPDALVLFAAGNDGADADADGRIDAGSLYAPASAKNVLTIGATEGPLVGAGLRKTWGDLDPSGKRYTCITDRTDAVSGEPDRIAMFSSAGPTVDGRTKPDLCTIGTNLAAPRSQLSPAKGWGLANPMPYYMYDGGTSSATGVAGGLAAQVRQAWTAARNGKAPLGATLKALLIAGALPVRGRGSYADTLPREAGYGRIDVSNSLPNQANRQILTFGEDEPGLATGSKKEYTIPIPAQASVRAVLCWYDVPGNRLVNDIDLKLIFKGEEFTPVGGPDRVNTVEIVEVNNLPAGDLTAAVIGYNVPDGPQIFSLVVVVTTPV